MKVYVKVKASEELPTIEGEYFTFGKTKNDLEMDTHHFECGWSEEYWPKYIEYWLKEIELPDEGKIQSEAIKFCLGYYPYKPDVTKETVVYSKGANFILNKLK